MKAVDEARQRSRSNEVRECALLALLLYSLVPGDASAGDSPQGVAARPNTELQTSAHAQIAAPFYPEPFAFVVPHAEAQTFSPTQFRARRPGMLETGAAADQGFVMDAPMLQDTSLARGLSEAKTQDRVRLLTLWQSRASSLSLQAGKRGAPSLQWSTPWMHRDAASRGLFDRWLAVAPRSFANAAAGSAPHQAGPIASAKILSSGTPIASK
jgi:hypothetical protein